MKLLLILLSFQLNAQLYAEVYGGSDGEYAPIGAGLSYNHKNIGLKANYEAQHKSESLLLGITAIANRRSFYSPGIVIGARLIERQRGYIELRNYFKIKEDRIFISVTSDKSVLAGFSLRLIFNNDKHKRFF